MPGNVALALLSLFIALSSFKVQPTLANVPFTIPFQSTYPQGQLVETAGAAFAWEVDSARKMLRGAIAATGNGWVGVGFNDNQAGMPGTDIVLCGRDLAANDTILARDMYAPRYGAPVPDPFQDVVTVASGITAQGVVWCEFERALETCDDSAVDFQITDVSLAINLLLAWGSTSEPQYHGTEQRRSLPFSFGSAAAPALPADVQQFSLVAPATVVSPDQGSYGCSYHVLPVNQASRFHIVHYKLDRSGPAVTAGVLHHVNLLGCSHAISGLTDGQAVSCDVVMGLCNEAVLTAGYTPEGTFLPLDAGIPIGNNAVQYVVISRHFYNPAGKTGLQDTGTQYRVQYTATLRPNELSMVALGTSQFEVPAHTFGHTVRSFCGSGCSTRLGTVTVTNVNFHMHAHGVRAAMRLIRGGVEEAPLAVADPFDPSQINFATNRQVHPGDFIVLECTYDNDLAVPLIYGDSISQEMCFGFLTIIGASKISQCIDLPWGINLSAPEVPQSVRDACALNPTYPTCVEATPRNYCPDTSDASASTVFLVDAERDAPYTEYWTTPPSACLPPPGCSVVPVPAEAGTCDGSPSSIVGAIDVPLGDMVDYSISWMTNCASQTVQFTVHARTQGWIALGLHDGGTATLPLALPLTRMAGADIVQGRASPASLRDRIGQQAYTIPIDKTSSVANLTSVTFLNGYTDLTFSRPFSSGEGVSLAADRFVWLIGAVNSGSGDFDAKHSGAAAVAMRVSLFGGRAESQRTDCTASNTTSMSVTSSTAAVESGVSTASYLSTSSSVVVTFFLSVFVYVF